MEETQIKKIKKLLTLLEPDALTREEFVKSFETVVKIINDLRKKNETEFDLIHQNIILLSKKLKEDNSFNVEDAKRQMNLSLSSHIREIESKFSSTMAKIDAKLLEVKDGEDADETRVVEAVLAQIPPAIEPIPETPEIIRDKLETLKEDERLDKSAIKGLREEIEELRSLISSKKGGGGGGFRKLKWIAETPTGDLDGVNAVFYLSTTPDPDNLLLVLNGMAQRNNSTFEYVLAGKKITYNSAPPAGSQHFAWFNK